MKSLDNRSISSMLTEVRLMEESNQIRTIHLNLAGNIGGFAYRSIRGIYYIIINENLNFETQTRVAYHEAKHILDSEICGIYICELDTNENYDIHEVRADDFADKAMLLKLASNFL